MTKLFAAAGIGLVLGCATFTGALAQKSANNFRFAVTEVQRGAGQYINSHRESYFVSVNIYERLLAYDDKNKKIVPQLASSWKEIDPTTFEFELRPGIAYHNGNKFDADDVVNILNTASDKSNPLSKPLYNAFRYAFVQRAEKLGDYTVRVKLRQASPLNTMRFAQYFEMYDFDTLKQLGGFVEYESKGIGTGSYKVIEMEPSKGIVLAKNDTYKPVEGRRAAATFNRASGIFMPDLNTQLANLLAGQIEAVRDVAKDQLDEIGKRPGFAVTAVDEFAMLEMSFDAIGRSGNKVFTDMRVRQALVKAIDREKLKLLLPGGDFARIQNTLCLQEMAACSSEGVTPPYAYDPAGAKKLLAEAGYPDGISFNFTARTATAAAATAIVEMWRQVGVTANMSIPPAAIVRSLRPKGQLQADIQIRPYHPLPDASLMFSFLFGAEERDYARDADIHKWGQEGETEFDPAKRTKLYSQILTRANEQAYVVPLTTTPTTYLHSTDIKIGPKQYSTTATMGDFAWK